MEKPIISLVASANRVKFWPRIYESLRFHQTPLEVVFVGDTQPEMPLPENFRWIHATVKPAQCYEIGFREAKGELVHWTADDADYCYKGRFGDCLAPLDVAYMHWKGMEAKYGNDKKSVVAMRPIEDGGDVWNFHHFFGGWQHTPMMAPFALLSRDYLVNTLGGYDKRFVSGQSENDVIMRVYQDGGRVEVCLDSMLYVHHKQVHPRDNQGREDNKFRKWYNTDRDVLEECWVHGGRGWYEKLNAMKPSPERESMKFSVPLSSLRLSPVQKFSDENITTVTQGIKGHWV